MAPRSEGSYGNGNGAEVVALYSPFIPIREQLQGCLGFKMIFFFKKGGHLREQNLLFGFYSVVLNRSIRDEMALCQSCS